MSEPVKSDALASVTNCGVCSRPLVYATDSVVRTCALCGKEERTLIYCPVGHYVCDSCHSKAAIDVLHQVLSTTCMTDPAAILEQVMAHPAVPMHGPEHHSMVPGVIVTAVRNAGYPVSDGAVEKAMERAKKVPGGWCGLYGACGAAIGAGIAVSILTGATPLTGKMRSLALAATGNALSQMQDDQPRCCKKAARIAVRYTVDFLHNRLGITLHREERVGCIYTLRNQQCAREQCTYYDSRS